MNFCYRIILIIFVFLKSQLSFAEIVISDYNSDGLSLGGNSSVSVTNTGSIVVGAEKPAIVFSGGNNEVISRGLIQSGNGNGIAVKANGSGGTLVVRLVETGLLVGAIDSGYNILQIGNSVDSAKNFSNTQIANGIYGDITSLGGITLNSSGLILGNINISANDEDKLVFLYKNALVFGNFNFDNNTESHLTLKDNATIDGNVYGKTKINIPQNNEINNVKITGNIGTSSSSLDSIMLGGGKLNLTGNSQNIYSNNIGINGSLNLSGEKITITTAGGIVINDGAEINLGSGSHSVIGALNISGEGAVDLTVVNQVAAGKINVDGKLSLGSGANLNINVAKSLYLKNNSSYTILSGSNSSTIAAITDNKINASGSNSNKIGLINFSTTVVDKNLILIASFDQNAYQPLSNLGRSVFNSVVNLDNPTAELLAVANYLIAGNIDNAARDKILDDISINNIGINQATYAAVTNVVNSVESRVEDDLHNLAINKNKINYFFSDDNIKQKNNKTWIKFLGATAKQENNGNFIGYNSKSSGISFGGDVKINRNTFVGAALGLTNSNIYASGGNKKTNLDGYQLNLYGSKNFDEYFIDAFVAASFNQYASKRAIPLVAEVASANYNGQTYLGKIKISAIKKPTDKIELLPEISLLTAHNSLDNYNENGAGALNLQVKNNSFNALEGAIGGALRYNSINVYDSKILPKIKFTYGYDFIGNKQISIANFVGQNSVFRAQTSKINRAITRFEVGFDVHSVNSLAIAANYALENKLGYGSRIASLRLRYEF